MHQVLLIIDVQPCFNPPPWLVEGINRLLGRMPSVATVERHDESRTPFARQLGWQPPVDDQSLVAADKVFIKHGYGPTTELLDYLKSLSPQRVLVCGMQSDFCVDTSVRRALSLGYEVVLLADAHTSVDNGVLTAAQIIAHHNVTFANMTSFGPRIRVMAVANLHTVPANGVRYASAIR